MDPPLNVALERLRQARVAVMHQLRVHLTEVREGLAGNNMPPLQITSRYAHNATHVEVEGWVVDIGNKYFRHCRGRCAPSYYRAVAIMEMSLFLLEHDVTMEERIIFYYNSELFSNEKRNCNNAIIDVCLMLDVPRVCLGITSAEHGSIIGNLQIFPPRNLGIDCNQGHGISGNVEDLMEYTFRAHEGTRIEAILVVESHGCLETLRQFGLFRLMPGLIGLSGRGYPDIGTRYLLKRLMQRFNIPAFCMTDADPDGLNIYLIYRTGSIRSVQEAALYSVQITWLGVWPSEISRLLRADAPLQANAPVQAGALDSAWLRLRQRTLADYNGVFGFSEHDRSKMQHLLQHEVLNFWRTPQKEALNAAYPNSRRLHQEAVAMNELATKFEVEHVFFGFSLVFYIHKKLLAATMDGRLQFQVDHNEARLLRLALQGRPGLNPPQQVEAIVVDD